MKKIIFPFFIALIISSCSERYYKSGVKNYNKFAYSKAIPDFEKYLMKHDKADAEIKLANSYRMANDIPNAEKWFSRVVLLPESEPINMFYYAKLLMILEKYDEAKIWFTNYLKKVPDDFVAEMLLVSCKTVNTFKKDTSLFTVKEAEIPEVATAFGETPYNDGIIFTADKVVFKNSDKYDWTGRSYLGIYYSAKDHSGKWMSPMMLKGNINGEYHEGPACFNKDGNVVYFTRSNYAKKHKLAKSSKSENNLKIYRAELVGEKWTNITELPFNNDEYSCGHPNLSPDGKTLYFISDMPGGMGGTDIYKSVYDDKSWSKLEVSKTSSVTNVHTSTYDPKAWSKPQNLGSVINTSGNEMFPYMHSDGTFYFSSDGHNSLGGLDVLMTSFNGEKWLQAENLNYPLNSSKDDFAYTLNKDGKTGYVSSNRDNFEDKIFEITKNDPTFILSGHVSQKGKPNVSIDSAIVEIYNQTEKTRQMLLTDNNGNYRMKLKVNSEYEVRSWKPMYFTITKPHLFCMVGKKISENFVANFVLDQIIIEKPIVLENIYYDLDKWEIRSDAAMELDRLVQVMEQNPKIHVELSSHTDSRAGDQYNMILSDKRAKAAVQYIISKGVDAKRMKWKGYGESKLVNGCKNDVPCTEEEHQKNRRTEFKVIKILN
jgi:outer membrane protein OmpA-like peptidoglycan-associated protein/tetratricopeptide (TPR) repeat protein